MCSNCKKTYLNQANRNRIPTFLSMLVPLNIGRIVFMWILQLTDGSSLTLYNVKKLSSI